MGKSRSTHTQDKPEVSKYRLKQITKNGRYAASCRVPLTGCPFKNGTLERLAWVKGWWQVENERQNAGASGRIQGVIK